MAFVKGENAPWRCYQVAFGKIVPRQGFALGVAASEIGCCSSPPHSLHTIKCIYPPRQGLIAKTFYEDKKKTSKSKPSRPTDRNVLHHKDNRDEDHAK